MDLLILPGLHHINPSPINSLPPEILSKIFILVDTRHVQSEFYGPTMRNSSRSTGSLLGSVCRHWRHVSLSAPALWASMLVHIEPDNLAFRTIERVRMHLERSACYPLSMTLTFCGGYATIMDSIRASLPSDAYLTKSPRLYSLISDIMNHASRIRHLSLVFACKPYASPLSFVASLRNCFPNVTHLTLVIPDDDPREALQAFSESPLLYSIDIPHLAVFPSGMQYNFPCSRITNLRIGDLLVEDMLTVFSTFPNLRSAEISLLEDELDEGMKSLHVPPLSFPYMHTLIIHIETLAVLKMNFVDVLNAIEAPALITFSFHVRELTVIRTFLQESFHFIFVPALLSFITQSPNIQSLHFNRIPFEDHHMLSILERVPKLMALEVTDAAEFTTPKANDRVVTTVHWLEELGHGRVVPRLQDLRLILHGYRLEKGVFEEMVKRRRSWDHPLRSAYLKVVDSREPDLDLECLKRLQQLDGLAVRVVYAPDLEQKEVELLGYGMKP